MANEGSVTLWLGHLKAGDSQKQAAAQQVWQRYYTALVHRARQNLRSTSRRVADEEDVVCVAMERFFRAVEKGQFPRLDDRDDLWQVLLVLTDRAASNQRREAIALKRGGGLVSGESALDHRADSPEQQRGLEQVVDDEPTPDFAVEVAENLRVLLERLADPQLRQAALLKLEGHSNKEISDELGWSLPTVERRFRRIRELLPQESPHARSD